MGKLKWQSASSTDLVLDLHQCFVATLIAGNTTKWMRAAESGNALTFHFCPICGSTVYWESEGFPGYIAVAIGSFADPNFPAPTIAVWEETRHPWVSLPPDTPPKRLAKQG